jgi:predicted AAA+ superfamily ATPase
VRSHPKSLRAKAGSADVTLLWLTDRESGHEKTVTPSLERMVSIIEAFIEEKKKPIILLDDIQYLVSNTNFEGVVRFLRSIVDSVTERNAIFMVSLSPESLKPQERSILEREMEVLRPGRIEEAKL